MTNLKLFPLLPGIKVIPHTQRAKSRKEAACKGGGRKKKSIRLRALPQGKKKTEGTGDGSGEGGKIHRKEKEVNSRKNELAVG